MTNETNEVKQTHWYYPDTYVSRLNHVVLAACNKVFRVSEIDLQNPTCEVCKSKMNEFENMKVEDD